MTFNITNTDKELLQMGNCYTFARLFCEKYPKIAKKNGFIRSEYRQWVYFCDGIFTVWHNNGDKDFFNINMEFTGHEDY